MKKIIGIKKLNRFFSALAILLCALFLSACGADYFLSSGCTFNKLDGKSGADSRALMLLDRFEEKISSNFPDSDISRINAAKTGERVEVSEDCAEMLRLCKEKFETVPQFSPSLYALTELWGFSNRNFRIPSENEIQNMLGFCNLGDVTVDGNAVVKKFTETKLDLGGIAKGYVLEQVLESLQKDEVKHGVVNLAGNLLLVGDRYGEPFTIAFDDPRSAETKNKYAAKAKLSDCYISTSSDSQNFYIENGVRYCHILDPKTGRPAQTDILSVSVILGTEVGHAGALCDLYSTALFLMGREEAIRFAQANGLRIFLVDNEGRYYSNFEVFDATYEALDAI